MKDKKAKQITAKQIAAWFVNNTDRESGDLITHLKVQKLVYYSQAWFLANFDEPLFDEDMQAWAHGPVAVSVYNKYKNYGFGPIPPEVVASAFASDIEAFLRSILTNYGQYSAKKLEDMTHEDAPWRIARAGRAPAEKCTNIIDKLIIRNFYADKLGKAKAQKI